MTAHVSSPQNHAKAKMSSMRKNPDFYYEKPGKIPEPIANILETYSKVPRDQQPEHILRVREHAYDARPYPCLGRFRFLELDLSTHPLYQKYVLPKFKHSSAERPDVFLDLGTCLAQDIRKLVVDGADPSKLYGSDIVPEFIDAGYELFRDEDRLPRDHFICPADVFDKSKNNGLSVLDGKVDVLHATAVFHLFSLEQQTPIAERCLRLLRKAPGNRSLVLGGQVGNTTAMESARKDGDKKFRHDGQTWQKLWQDVCAQDEFRGQVKNIEVKVDLQQRSLAQAQAGEQQKHIGNTDDGFRWMVWQVWVEF